MDAPPSLARSRCHRQKRLPRDLLGGDSVAWASAPLLAGPLCFLFVSKTHTKTTLRCTNLSSAACTSGRAEAAPGTGGRLKPQTASIRPETGRLHSGDVEK